MERYPPSSSFEKDPVRSNLEAQISKMEDEIDFLKSRRANPISLAQMKIELQNLRDRLSRQNEPAVVPKKTKKEVIKKRFLFTGGPLDVSGLDTKELQGFTDEEANAWDEAQRKYTGDDKGLLKALDKLARLFQERGHDKSASYIVEMIQTIEQRLTRREQEEEEEESEPFNFVEPPAGGNGSEFKDLGQAQSSPTKDNTFAKLSRILEISKRNQVHSGPEQCIEIYVFPPLFLQKASLGSKEVFCFQTAGGAISASIDQAFSMKPYINGHSLEEATQKIRDFISSVISNRAANVELPCFKVVTPSPFRPTKEDAKKQVSDEDDKKELEGREIQVDGNDVFKIEHIFSGSLEEEIQEKKSTKDARFPRDEKVYNAPWFLQQFRNYVIRKVAERPQNALVVVLPLPVNLPLERPGDDSDFTGPYNRLADAIAKIGRLGNELKTFQTVDNVNSVARSLETEKSETDWLKAANLASIVPIRVQFEKKGYQTNDQEEGEILAAMRKLSDAASNNFSQTLVEISNALSGFGAIEIREGEFPLLFIPDRERSLEFYETKLEELLAQDNRSSSTLLSVHDLFFRTHLVKRLKLIERERQIIVEKGKPFREGLNNQVTLAFSPLKTNQVVALPRTPPTTPGRQKPRRFIPITTTPLGVGKNTKGSGKQEVTPPGGDTTIPDYENVAEKFKRGDDKPAKIEMPARPVVLNDGTPAVDTKPTIKTPLIEVFGNAEFGSRFDSF